MALIPMGGWAAETVTLLLGGGGLGPDGGANVSALLYTTSALSVSAPTLNVAGAGITVTSDAGGGVPRFYIDDTVTRQVWISRGALPPLQLFGPTVTGIVGPDGIRSGDVTLDTDDIVGLSGLLTDKVDTSAAGVANGYATLDGSGHIPSGQVAGTTAATPSTTMARDAAGKAFVADPAAGQEVNNFQKTASMIAAVVATAGDAKVTTDYAIPLSSSTAVLVTGLSISAVAGDTWHIAGTLLYTATTVANFAWTLKIPGGASTAVGRATGLVGGVSKTVPIYWGNTLGNHLSDNFDGLGLVQANICAVVFDARIVIATTGTIEIKVAQVTPQATQGYVFAGSYMLGAKAP